MTIVAFYSKGTSIEVQNTWSKRLKFYYPSLKLVPLLSEEAKFATVALLWKAPLNYLNKMKTSFLAATMAVALFAERGMAAVPADYNYFCDMCLFNNWTYCQPVLVNGVQQSGT